MGNLAPQAVQVDSTDSRGHRRNIATTLNQIIKKLFTPNAIASGTASGDATATINCTGNPVLITGRIAVGSGSATWALKRGSTTLATFGNSDPTTSLPVVWLDNPGVGTFAYSTDGSGHTINAALSLVEFK